MMNPLHKNYLSCQRGNVQMYQANNRDSGRFDRMQITVLLIAVFFEDVTSYVIAILLEYPCSHLRLRFGGRYSVVEARCWDYKIVAAWPKLVRSDFCLLVTRCHLYTSLNPSSWPGAHISTQKWQMALQQPSTSGSEMLRPVSSPYTPLLFDGSSPFHFLKIPLFLKSF